MTAVGFGASELTGDCIVLCSCASVLAGFIAIVCGGCGSVSSGSFREAAICVGFDCMVCDFSSTGRIGGAMRNGSGCFFRLLSTMTMQMRMTAASENTAN